MKRGLKRFLIFILVGFGVLYLSKSNISFVKGLIYNENKIDLNKSDELANGNNININNDGDLNDYLLLVNKEHELSKNYKPKNLIIPDIPFTDLVNNEEKYVAGVIEAIRKFN